MRVTNLSVWIDLDSAIPRVEHLLKLLSPVPRSILPRLAYGLRLSKVSCNLGFSPASDTDWMYRATWGQDRPTEQIALRTPSFGQCMI